MQIIRGVLLNNHNNFQWLDQKNSNNETKLFNVTVIACYFSGKKNKKKLKSVLVSLQQNFSRRWLKRVKVEEQVWSSRKVAREPFLDLRKLEHCPNATYHCSHQPSAHNLWVLQREQFYYPQRGQIKAGINHNHSTWRHPDIAVSQDMMSSNLRI